jgi:hypothetical protein
MEVFFREEIIKIRKKNGLGNFNFKNRKLFTFFFTEILTGVDENQIGFVSFYLMN